MIKLGISGARGRMGTAIAQLAIKDKKNFRLHALLEYPGHPQANGDIGGVSIQTDNSAISGCDAWIEFTLPEATITNLNACVKYKTRMVIGTTGFTPEQITMIEKASAKIPIVFASNMSIGVNVLFKLIEISAGKLTSPRMTIQETHHVHNKDKPSGTAKTMAQIAQKAAGHEVSAIESFREGEVIGDHTIVFETDDDTLTLSHHAKGRSMFAQGALEAAKFLMNHKTGLYTMQDVLGLK